MKKFVVASFGFLIFFQVLEGQNFSGNQKSDFANLDFDYSYIEACKFLALENYSLADQFFTNCLSINSLDDGTLYNLARVKLYLNDPKTALIYAEKLNKLKTGNIWYSLLLSRIYQQLGDISNAIRVFEDVVRLNPKNIDLYFNLNDLYIAGGYFKKAIKNNILIERNFGIIDQAIIQQAGLYSRVRKFKLAYGELKKLTTQFPNEVKYLLIIAEFCIDNGKLDLANYYYNKILLLDPKNGFAHVSLSEYYRQINKMDSAIFHLGETFTSRDIDVDAKLKIILGLYDIYKNDTTIISQLNSLINKLYLTHPENLNIQILLANSKLINKNYIEAQELLINVIKERKDNYQLWEQLLYVDNRLLNFEAMYLHSSEAIKFFPNQALLYLFKGLSGLQYKNPIQAEEALCFGVQLITSSDPLYHDFLNYLSEAYYTNGNVVKAFETFEKLLVIDSLNLGVLNNYSYYLSVQNQELDKALLMSKITIDKEPENPTFLDTFGWILYQLGKYEESKVYLLKAAELNDFKNGTVVEHLGDVYFKLNSMEFAKKYWNMALELDPGNFKIVDKIKNLEL